MWKLAVALLAFASPPSIDGAPSSAATQEISSPIIGRWDIHIAQSGKTLPSWLEVADEITVTGGPNLEPGRKRFSRRGDVDVPTPDDGGRYFLDLA